MWGLLFQMDPGKIKKNQNNSFLSGRISSEVFQTDARKPPQEDLKDAESIRRILKPGALESFVLNIPCCALITLDPPLCFLETENMPEKWKHTKATQTFTKESVQTFLFQTGEFGKTEPVSKGNSTLEPGQKVFSR